MDAFVEGSLLFHLAQLPDPRSRRGRQHPLSAVLALACCAILCGARSFKAIGEWAKNYDLGFMHRLGFTRTPIGGDGIRKVLIAVGPVALEDALTAWARHVLGPPAGDDVAPTEAAPTGVALDGKTARGSFDGLRQAVHLLSLVAHQSGLTLAQAPVPNGVEDKTNEHKASLKMLERLALEGMVVTGDAMFCHRDVCETILAQQGDYFLFVKENQPTLLEDVKAAMAPPPGAFSPSAAANLAGRTRRGDHLREGTWA